MNVLLLLIMIVVAAGVVLLMLQLQAKQRERWRRFAERHGLRYLGADDSEAIAGQHESFELFKTGHARSADHVLDGTHGGLRLRIFEYRFRTGSGKHQVSHVYAVLMAKLPIDAPQLIIRPETFGDKIGAFFGFPDYNFEYEEFNKRFCVKGPDKKFAYDICHARMMEFLLQGRGLSWELGQDHLLLYRKDGLDEETVLEFLAEAQGFVERIPGYLLRS